MKKVVSLFLCALTALSLGVQIYADSYADDCTSAVNDNVRSYQNLEKCDFLDLSVWDCGEPIVLMATQAMADVTYRISGATTVTVTLFTKGASFATKGSPKGYQLGGAINTISSAYRCFYDNAKNTAFLCDNGTTYAYRNDPNLGYQFVEEKTPLLADCFFGLNISTSVDGSTDQPALCTLTQVEKQGPFDDYYREMYVAQLPATATEIKLSLRDLTERSRNFMFAHVQFDGEHLVAGGSTGGSSSSASASQTESQTESQPELKPESQSASQSESGNRPEPSYHGGGSTKRESNRPAVGIRKKTPPVLVTETENTVMEYDAAQEKPARGSGVSYRSEERETTAEESNPQTEELEIHTDFINRVPAKKPVPQKELFGGVIGGGAGMFIVANLLRGLRR